jgi:uncharacterized protein
MDQINSKSIALNPFSIMEASQGFRSCEKERYAFHYISVFKYLFLLLFMFNAPVALIWLKIIPFEYRFYAFFCVLAGFISYCFLRRYSLHELGFRTDNFNSSLRWNLLFCIVGTICLYGTYKAGLLRPKNSTSLPDAYIYIFYILFLGPAQEVVFRGIFFAEMKRAQILDNKWVLLVSTLSFCFLHIIYRHPPLLIIALISGLVWGIIYTKWPNIWGVALSHSLLGALAIFLGVI